MKTTPLPPDASTEAPALEADLVEAFCAAQAAGDIDAALAQRVKQRVLRSIAEAESRHLTVRAGDGDWQPFGSGVQLKMLHERDGIMSYLLKLAPGAALPPHRHPQDEECVVLEGVIRLGELEVGPGGFHLACRDALHGVLSTVTGATLYLRGAVPTAEHCF